MEDKHEKDSFAFYNNRYAFHFRRLRKQHRAFRIHHNKKLPVNADIITYGKNDRQHKLRNVFI
jgi:hypothetical protein